MPEVADNVEQLIRDGATPRALEVAIAYWETENLAKRLGIETQALANLRKRWGITREGAQKALGGEA